MKEYFCTVCGIVGGGIAAAFGGWDAALATLVICMAMDYATGLVVAAVFHNSPKTPSGGLESRAGYKGLIRKGMMLAVVLVACRLDLVMGSTFIRDGVIIAFIANEVLSIVENAGLMGVPIPGVIKSAIEVLRHRSEEHIDDDHSVDPQT